MENVSRSIIENIKLLDEARRLLRDRATEKSIATSNYDRAMAITIIKLKNGVEFDIDGETIINPPVTIIDKIARGVCYKEKLEMDKAEALYKNTIVTLDSIKTIINAYQSINKYQSEV